MEMTALHLLILEDNPDDAELAVKELDRKGFDVKWTRVDTEQAFRKALAEKPDMILADYHVPSFDAIAALQIYKQLKLKIPLIIFSGTVGEEVAIECMKSGATDYVLKNNLSRLYPVVKRALEEMKIYKKNRQAEEVLRKSERRYKQLYSMTRLMCDNLPELIWTKDLDNRFIFANKACCEKLLNAKDTDEPVGKTDIYFAGREKKSHPENPEYHTFGETCKGSDMVVLKTKKPLRSDESGNLKGKFVCLNVYKAPFLDENGNLIGTVGCARDITREKEIEKEQRKAEEENKKLEAQLFQAQKMEAIGTLAGGIAHDFNNLLTVIIGNAQLALINTVKDESSRNVIEEIKKAGDKAASLTRQLLAFSRKQIIKPVIININELLADVEKILVRLIVENVELLIIPGTTLWNVKIDPGQMEQVIINLAVNARDAMPHGGKLTLETANSTLNENYFREHGIEGKKSGHYVVLAISDTGAGIDKKIIKHIFEPFFTTKKVGKGTGLGLSTVYGIAKQNNGFIWVYSEPGRGSTFKIYLPKVKKNAELKKKEQIFASGLGGSETVLIVEDDDSLRNLAEKTLRSYEYKILVAENGEDALRVCKKHDSQIDLMVTDVVMPRMGGKKLAKKLQSLYPEIKVIYMSGYTDNAIVHHGVLAPDLNFLEKPFSPEDLALKVRKVLDNEKNEHAKASFIA